ncbi:hypothetical protein HWV62_3817 [Athelia sp. TMB]|nr:hypothetical protein HWV62_3817 [Athelia sp. TMB]
MENVDTGEQGRTQFDDVKQIKASRRRPFTVDSADPSALDHPGASTSSIFSSSLSSLGSSASLSSSSSFASTSYTVPDLAPLKKSTSFKALDPSKQICQYELPGGGVCRDAGCEDIHLSRVADVDSRNAEPSDEDTAEYLYDNLSAIDVPPSWRSQERGAVVATIQDALQALRGTGKTLEERVAATLSTLQPPAPT